jgi:hypothetical protein
MPVTLRSLLLGLGLALTGCSKSGPGPAYATLGDARGLVAFSPDGISVIVPALPRVYSYDLGKKAVIWTHIATKPGAGVAFSPRGAYVLIVESETADPRGFAFTLLRADGARILDKSIAHELNPANPRRFVDRTQRLFAISDDGAFVACGVFATLQVFSTADGSVVHTETTSRIIEAVAFEPGTHRLAFGAEFEPRLRVADRVGGAWVDVQTFEGGFDPTWTAAGLVFGSAQGLELWDGKSRSVVLPADEAFPDARPDATLTVPLWAASPDGLRLASWSASRVSVWKVSDAGKAPVFTYDEPGLPLGKIIWLAAWAPGHFRAFTKMGYFFDLETPSGKVARRVSFGPPGSTSKALFTDGVQYHANYFPTLAPTGRWVALDVPEEGTAIYLME